MFQNLLEKKHEINFFDYSNCHAFEIPNFLDDKNLKSICVELNPNFNEHSKVVKILREYFNDYKKFEWYNGQEVFNYIFKR